MIAPPVSGVVTMLPVRRGVARGVRVIPTGIDVVVKVPLRACSSESSVT